MTIWWLQEGPAPCVSDVHVINDYKGEISPQSFSRVSSSKLTAAPAVCEKPLMDVSAE